MPVWTTNYYWNSNGATITVTTQAAPVVAGVAPNAGTGVSQTFTFSYSSVNGYKYLNIVYGQVNGTLSPAHGCRVEYQPGSNRLYLENDANTAELGPLTPGGSGTESNSQCTLTASASSASGSGNNMILNVALTFTPAFAGSKNLYGYAADKASLNSGWKTLGAWNTGP